MSRLDLSGLRDLWYRIDDIFARLSEAIGSISFSGTTLSWSYANGASAGSVDLDQTFAKDTEAAGSMTSSGYSIQLKSVSGSGLGSAIDLSTLLKAYFARGISVSGSTLKLENGNGSQLDSVTLPAADFYATSDKSGDVVTLEFRTPGGNLITSVNFNVSDS